MAFIANVRVANKLDVRGHNYDDLVGNVLGLIGLGEWNCLVTQIRFDVFGKVWAVNGDSHYNKNGYEQHYNNKMHNKMLWKNNSTTFILSILLLKNAFVHLNRVLYNECD